MSIDGPVAAALLALFVSPRGADEPPRADEPLLRLDVGARHAIAADERHALFHDADQRVVVVDLRAARLLELPPGGPWRAGCFTADGASLWLLEEGGGARRFSLAPSAPVAPDALPPADASVALGAGGGWHDLVASPDGRSLAWSAMRDGERRAGVIAVEDGRELARFANVTTAAMAHDDPPWIAYVGPGAHVVVQVEQDGGGLRAIGHDDGALLVWSLAEQRAVARFRPYVTHQTPGVALLPDGLAIATRDGRDFQLLRWRIGDARPAVLLADARGGHFIDLFASPCGQWLCEQDLEEDDGVAVVDLAGSRPPRTVGAGHRFIGFASAPLPQEIPPTGVALDAGLLARARDGSIERIACSDGSRQQRFAPEAGFTATAARWCCRVPRLLLVGYHLAADGTSCDWEAQLHSLRPDGK